MAKNYTFPYLFDEEKSISITDFKLLGYLKNNRITSGNVNWKMRGEITGSISVKATMSNDTNFIDFSYTCNNEKYNYRVYLVSVKSNLNKGKIWYFECRFTGVRCRKLHLISERFMHRSALPTGMYASQTQSKKWRSLKKVYGSYFDSDNLYQELYSKYFKTHYKGKPTKRYLRILNKRKQANQIKVSDIKNLLNARNV
ncbi:MAG: hypothetical protein ACI9WV_001144 [Patiriisocius sp.]|jgi:hypothetical protein